MTAGSSIGRPPRIGTLMIRQFVDTRRSHLAVLLDTQPRSYRDADEFELAVSIAGSLSVPTPSTTSRT